MRRFTRPILQKNSLTPNTPNALGHLHASSRITGLRSGIPLTPFIPHISNSLRAFHGTAAKQLTFEKPDTRPSTAPLTFVMASCIDDRVQDAEISRAVHENNGFPPDAKRSHFHRTAGPSFQDAEATYGIADIHGGATQAHIITHTDCKKFSDPIQGAIQHVLDFHRSPLFKENGGSYAQATAYLYDIEKPSRQRLVKKMFIIPGNKHGPATLCIRDVENNRDTDREQRYLLPPTFDRSTGDDGSQKQDSHDQTNWKETLRNISVALKDLAVATVVTAQILYYSQIQRNRTGEAEIEQVEARILRRLEEQQAGVPSQKENAASVSPSVPPSEKPPQGKAAIRESEPPMDKPAAQAPQANATERPPR